MNISSRELYFSLKMEPLDMAELSCVVCTHLVSTLTENRGSVKWAGQCTLMEEKYFKGLNTFESCGFSWNSLVDLCTHSITALVSKTTLPHTSQAEELVTVFFTTACSNNTANLAQKCAWGSSISINFTQFYTWKYFL